MDEEKKEEKFDGVSEQNAPKTSEGDGEVKTPSVGDITLNTSAKIDYNKENEKAADAYAIAKAVEGYDYKGKVYDDMISQLKSPETEEQRKKRERQEKSRKIIGAVSDGLSALGNLFFTHHYAPNMYNHEKGSMTSAIEKSIEKARAEREANDNAYYNLALKIGDNKNERAKTVRELEAQAEAQKIAKAKLEMAQAEADRKAKLFDPQFNKAVADAETAGYKSQTAQTEAEYAPDYYAGRNRLNDERIKTEGTKQENNRASAYEHTQKGNNAGGEGKKPFHFDGKDYTKDSENDYKSAITEAAREVNLYFAEKNPDGSVKKVKKYKDGKEIGEEIVYRPGFEPIEVGYEDIKGVTRYYDWAETAARVTPRLNQMRKEQAKNNGWSLKEEKKETKSQGGGWSLK